MGLFLLCAGLFALSGFLYWLGSKQALLSNNSTLIPETTVAQLSDLASSVAKELEPGSFRQLSKIRGKIVCAAPLISELGQTPCVFYRFSVTREYEELVWEKDASGTNVQRLLRRSELVASNTRSVPFLLDDGTGTMPVVPEGAKIETIRSHSSFQPAGSALQIGTFFLTVPLIAGGTIGYRSEEEILPVDEKVSVIAEASDEDGVLSLRKPESSDQLFVVSTRSFKELTVRQRSAQVVPFVASVAIAVLGAVFLLLGVIR